MQLQTDVSRRRLLKARVVQNEFHFALPTNEISAECTVLLKKQNGSDESISSGESPSCKVA